MKKIYTYMMMALMALPMLTLTSCDRDAEDRMEARTLEGTWVGYIKDYYSDRWHREVSTYETAFYFYRDSRYATGGTGREVDYNVDGWARDYYCTFEWYVENRRIYIRYADGQRAIISDYFLDGDYFEGNMEVPYWDGGVRTVHFRLRYNGNYYWDRWTHYYTPKRAGQSGEDQTQSTDSLQTSK